MKRRYLAVLATALMMPFSASLAEEFPSAPPNLKEVESKGMPRLSAEELKAFFPGVIVSRSSISGQIGTHVITHNSDGTYERKGLKKSVVVIRGKWRIDEKNNTYCRDFTGKKGYENNCFAVFKAPDGIHYFDYDVQDGLYAYVWRKSSDQ